MTDFMQALLSASLYGSVVIGVILLLRLVLRKAPKKYICLLWLLAAVRLLLPFQIESSLSLQPSGVPDLPARLEQSVQSQAQNPTPPIPGGETDLPDPTPTPPEPVETPTAPASDVTIPMEPSTPVIVKKSTDPMVVAGWIWAAVAMSMVLYSTVSYLRLRRRVSDAVILSEGVWVTKLDTAMVLGFFRPRVYLNAGLDQVHRDFVLRHEKCHIRRGDHWWKPLGYLTLAIHWFNPLVWLGYILLCRDLEMACDEAVIRHLDLPQRKSYSAALLSCSAHRHAIAACPVAFGEVSVKERIKNVLHYKKPAFWVILVSVIVVAVVAVCFLTTPKTSSQEPEIQVPDDWGITVSAEDATAGSVTFCFTQTGASPEAGYSYDQVYTVELWNGSTWETVEPATPPIFTKELLWLNVNGETNIHIDWTPFYGQLPDGYYRIGKTVTDSVTDTARTYYISFQLGEGGESAAVLSQEAVLTMFYNKMDQLKATGRHHLLHEYAVETDFPYLTGFTLEDWYADGKWYISRENRFTDGTAHYAYMNAGGDTYVRCWSDDVPGMVNLDWHIREGYTYSTIAHKDWRALEVGKFISEKTEDGMVYTIVLLTGATGDVTEPIYENYYTIRLDENANILGMRCYVHGKFYHTGWGRSGYWDTKYDITITVLDADTETLYQKIDAAMAEINK